MNPKYLRHQPSLFIMLLLCILGSACQVEAFEDTLNFGDNVSETNHHFSTDKTCRLISKNENKALKEKGLPNACRILLPRQPPHYQGGRMSFTMKCHPDQQNYFSIKLWGDDINENLLILNCEGQQIGYRHLGDIDILDHGSSSPAYTNRFFYTTCPLPISLTTGKTQLNFEIVSTGRIWGYGRNFAQYQKNQTTPSRGIYSVYTHTDAHLKSIAYEKQGRAPSEQIRPDKSNEALAEIKRRLVTEVRKLLVPRKINNQMHLNFVAQAFHESWSPVYKDKSIVPILVAGMDRIYKQYEENPKLASYDKSTWNPDWFGFGPFGHSICLLEPHLDKALSDFIDDGHGRQILRRKAWANMLNAGVEHLRRYRRQYTNQSMIIDLNLHWNNRALQLLDSKKGIPLERTLRYLYESVGLLPWSGKETLDGKNTWPLGKNYYQLTKKGLTKELGYVGNYGEVMDWVGQIYNSTRPTPNQAGNEQIRKQMTHMLKARSIFRYPMFDRDGYKTMKLETIVGWRDTYHPGYDCYASRGSRDSSALFASLASGDEISIGHCQQMLEDRQFLNSELIALEENSFRATMGRMSTLTELNELKKMPQKQHRLPMSVGQPNFVWSDEENGVLAIKDGEHILYASLYWRARFAINHLAKIHLLTPSHEIIATVVQRTEFKKSGVTCKRPNYTNFGFSNGGHRYPDAIDSAHREEVLSIAKHPRGVVIRPGHETPYAGRGTFYLCHYGDYLLAMNCSNDTEQHFEVPREFENGLVFPSGPQHKSGTMVTCPPASTIVLKKLAVPKPSYKKIMFEK